MKLIGYEKNYNLYSLQKRSRLQHYLNKEVLLNSPFTTRVCSFIRFVFQELIVSCAQCDSSRSKSKILAFEVTENTSDCCLLGTF